VIGEQLAQPVCLHDSERWEHQVDAERRHVGTSEAVLARLAQGVSEELVAIDRCSADDCGHVRRDGAAVGSELLFDAHEEPGVWQDDVSISHVALRGWNRASSPSSAQKR